MDNFQQTFDQNLGAQSSGGFGAGTYQYGAPRSRATTIIAIVMLIISLGVTGGVWFWHYKTLTQLDEARAVLASASHAYVANDIKELSDVRDKLDRAKDLVGGHTIPSSLIDFLGDNTESTVYWSDFGYHRGGSDAKGGGDTISLNGSAQGYNGLIQQMDRFRTGAGGVIMKSDLGSYSLDDKTNLVNFSVALTINPQYVTLPAVTARGVQIPSTDTTAIAPPVTPSTLPVTPQTESTAPSVSSSTAPEKTVTAPATPVASTTTSAKSTP